MIAYTVGVDWILNKFTKYKQAFKTQKIVYISSPISTIVTAIFVVVVCLSPTLLVYQQIISPPPYVLLSIDETIVLAVMISSSLILLMIAYKLKLTKLAYVIFEIAFILVTFTYLYFIFIGPGQSFIPYCRYIPQDTVNIISNIGSQIALLLCFFAIPMSCHIIVEEIQRWTFIIKLFVPFTITIVKVAGYLFPFLIPISLFPIFSQEFWSLMGTMGSMSIILFIIFAYLIPYLLAILLRLKNIKELIYDASSDKIVQYSFEQLLNDAETSLNLKYISKIERNEEALCHVKALASKHSEEFGRIPIKVILTMLVHPILLLLILAVYLTLLMLFCIPDSLIILWSGIRILSPSQFFGLYIDGFIRVKVMASIFLSTATYIATLLASLSTGQRLKEFFDETFSREIYLDSLLLALDKYHTLLWRMEHGLPIV
jgi:hypothetical protein